MRRIFNAKGAKMAKGSGQFLYSRRNLLLGTGLVGAAAATVWAWPEKWQPLLESDKAAKEAEKQERREIKEIAKRERKAATEES